MLMYIELFSVDARVDASKKAIKAAIEFQLFQFLSDANQELTPGTTCQGCFCYFSKLLSVLIAPDRKVSSY